MKRFPLKRNSKKRKALDYDTKDRRFTFDGQLWYSHNLRQVISYAEMGRIIEDLQKKVKKYGGLPKVITYENNNGSIVLAVDNKPRSELEEGKASGTVQHRFAIILPKDYFTDLEQYGA